MSDTPQLTIEIQLDDGTVKKGIAKLSEHFKPAGKKSGEEFGDSLNSGIENKLMGIKGKLLALAGSLAAGLTFGAAVSEAADEEEAVSRLGAALQMAGQYSKKTSDDIVDFASQMQRTTRFSDDAVLSTMSFIEQLAALDEKGLKRATQASADLATMLRMDLQSAAMLVAKAAEGNITMFGKYGIAVKEGASNSETFANALAAIEKKAKGLAQMDLRSFSGVTAYLGNMSKNLLGAFGDGLVKNPAILATIKVVGERLDGFAEKISKLTSNKQWQTDISNGLIKIGNAALYAIRPFEIVYNIAEGMGKFGAKAVEASEKNELLATGLRTTLETILKLPAGTLKLANSLGDVEKKLLDTRVASNGFLGEIGSQITKGTFTDSLRQFGADVNLEMGKIIKDKEEMDKKISAPPPPMETPVSEGTLNIMAVAMANNEAMKQDAADGANFMSNTYSKMGNSITQSFQRMYLSSAMFSRKIADTITNSLVNGAGQAFASFGKALVEGDNALKAMANSFISTLGQMSVQIGIMFIAQGLAMAFSMNPLWQAQAGPLIAAGAALATLGGAMQAFGGGGGSKGGGSGYGGAPASYSGSEQAAPIQSVATKEEKQEPSKVINVVIHGSVMDSRETGLRIVDLINQAVEGNGARVYA